MGRYYSNIVGEYFIPEGCWNANEVAEIFGVSRYTICNWAFDNGIEKEHGAYAFNEEDLIRFAKQSDKYELRYFRWKCGGDLKRIMEGDVDIY